MVKAVALPSQDYLNSILRYDSETGHLFWKNGIPNARPYEHSDAPVGYKARGEGYLCVVVNKRSYLQHRIIWKMVTGEEPLATIDHKDLDKRNNRWDNLRTATYSSNCCNSGRRVDNTSGFKGIFRSKNGQGWVGGVVKDGKRVYFKTFYDLEEAVRTIAEKRAEIHGEFARNG